MTAAKKTTKTAAAFEAFDPKALFNVGSFDLDKIIEFNRKNVEAFVEANRLTFDAYKTVAERQVELVKADVDAFTKNTNFSFEPKASFDVQKNIETAKVTFEDARAVLEKKVADTRELAELTAKAHQEAFAVLKARFEAGVEEVRGFAA